MNQESNTQHASEEKDRIAQQALIAAQKAEQVLKESAVQEICRKAGCRVNIVGSLRMGLLAKHRDIDLHIYSKGITEESSFAILSQIAKNRNVTEIKCINGLRTDEHCIAWHITYRDVDDALWQIDLIHIEESTEYDGYFERMADRIAEVMTPEQKETILRLKFETPSGFDYHGVEYYEAVIADGVSTMADLHQWIASHRCRPPYYWIP